MDHFLDARSGLSSTSHSVNRPATIKRSAQTKPCLPTRLTLPSVGRQRRSAGLCAVVEKSLLREPVEDSGAKSATLLTSWSVTVIFQTAFIEQLKSRRNEFR